MLAVAVIAGAAVTLPLATAAATANSQVAGTPPLTFLHVVTPTSGPDRTPYLADAAAGA